MKQNNIGKFGIFGGRHVPETLIPALDELEYNSEKLRKIKNFRKYDFSYFRTILQRPTPLYYARNLTDI